MHWEDEGNSEGAMGTLIVRGGGEHIKRVEWKQWGDQNISSHAIPFTS